MTIAIICLLVILGTKLIVWAWQRSDLPGGKALRQIAKNDIENQMLNHVHEFDKTGNFENLETALEKLQNRELEETHVRFWILKKWNSFR